MDWERKFASIVRETEENLMKVRNKMNGKPNVDGHYSLYKYESPHHRKYSMDYTPSRSLRLSHYDRTQIPSPGRVHVDSDYLGSTHSNIVQLQERLEAQNKTIEQLTSLVKNLEIERNQYKLQIDQLRSEISVLNSSFVANESSTHMKWQIDHMKKEVSKEIDHLRSQLITLKAKSVNRPYSDSSSSVISKDIRNMRSDVQEEMHYLRRDLDVLKSRMGSLEHNVTSFSTQQEIQRRQLLNKDLENYKQRRLVDTLTTLPLADKSLDTSQLEQLRRSVNTLKYKIDHVEGKMKKLPPLSSSPTNDYIDSSDDGEISSDITSSYDQEDVSGLTSSPKQQKSIDESFDTVSLGFDEHDEAGNALDSISLGSDVDDFDLKYVSTAS